MSNRTIPAGFHRIERHDRLLQEQVHDAYQASGKLSEPTVCPQCGSVFRSGRWQWGDAPAGAHSEACPACRRIQDQYPAGYLTIAGPFFLSHKDEIMHLVRNHERGYTPAFTTPCASSRIRFSPYHRTSSRITTFSITYFTDTNWARD